MSAFYRSCRFEGRDSSLSTPPFPRRSDPPRERARLVEAVRADHESPAAWLGFLSYEEKARFSLTSSISRLPPHALKRQTRARDSSPTCVSCGGVCPCCSLSAEVRFHHCVTPDGPCSFFSQLSADVTVGTLRNGVGLFALYEMATRHAGDALAAALSSLICDSSPWRRPISLVSLVLTSSPQDHPADWPHRR